MNRPCIKKNTEALVIASKKTGLEVNAGKTKYMVMSSGQNEGQCHNIKTDNSSFERVEQFKYLGTTLTNKNSVQEETKSRLKSGILAIIQHRYLLSSSLLSKNIKTTICRTTILSVILCGCENWLLTLREEHGLRVFENRVLSRHLGLGGLR